MEDSGTCRSAHLTLLLGEITVRPSRPQITWKNSPGAIPS